MASYPSVECAPAPAAAVELMPGRRAMVDQPPKRRINDACVELATALETLAKMLVDLEQRLDPVLTPVATPPNGAKFPTDANPQCQTAVSNCLYSIDKAADDVRALQTRVIGLFQRIEL